MKLLDERSNETVDILSHIFQFLELSEIYALQKASPFLYRTIDHLKRLFIKQIYDIGLISDDALKITDFVNNYLKFQDFILKNCSYTYFGIDDAEFQRLSKEFVFKRERILVSFYPIVAIDMSLESDSFNTLEGFIFLNPNNKNGYSKMPDGCKYCATLLDCGNSQVSNEEIEMPVKKFGMFKIDSMETASIYQAITDCIGYISENSDRALKLNSIGNGFKSNLLEKLESICKESNDEKVLEILCKMFNDRFPIYQLLLAEKIRYTVRKINFFSLPHAIQVNLLERLYKAYLGSGNYEINENINSIDVIFNQTFTLRDIFSEKSKKIAKQTTISFKFLSQEVVIRDIEKNKKNCLLC